jgi:hypothetical protein
MVRDSGAGQLKSINSESMAPSSVSRHWPGQNPIRLNDPAGHDGEAITLGTSFEVGLTGIGVQFGNGLVLTIGGAKGFDIGAYQTAGAGVSTPAASASLVAGVYDADQFCGASEQVEVGPFSSQPSGLSVAFAVGVPPISYSGTNTTQEFSLQQIFQYLDQSLRQLLGLPSP